VSRTKRIVLLDRLHRQARLHFRQLFELTHPAALKPLDHVLRYGDLVRSIPLTIWKNMPGKFGLVLEGK
jgi:hypothetical protein